MDISFDLISSMSPKIRKNHKTVQKLPTKLALKKYFRKSLVLTQQMKLHETIISINSSISSTESGNNSPIMISDSEESRVETPRIARNLSRKKLSNIKQWVNDVNAAKVDCSVFSDVSEICDNVTNSPKMNIAISSTLIENGERFHNLFKTNKNDEIINDSFDDHEGCDNNNKKAIVGEPPTNDNRSPDRDIEDLLDSLYGDSWRNHKDKILPTPEPRKKLEKKAVPKSDSRIKRNKNFENNKQTVQSPWVQSLKHICDSDTDDSSEKHNLQPLRLDFGKNVEKENKIGTEDNVTPLKKHIPKEKQRTYSFLASLSGSTPLDKIDMAALIFRKHYQQHRETLAVKLFKLFNEKVFDCQVPENTVIEWNPRLRGTAGMCSCRKITRSTGVVERGVKLVLSTKILDAADRLRDTLIHEMCHAATWIVNEVADGHGSFWKSWAHRAMKTFPELPPIMRCHDYVINTKYTYKCTGCGYSIGRHSKSLNIETKRCGYCRQKFEVFINKVDKKGEPKSVPATPKKQPNGFALFIKENYADFKSPGLKHGDIMKILGQKFSDMKVNKT